jgi:serine/threonine protein kinase
MSPRVGVTLSGRYRLQRLIATGGMGQVWEGIDSRLGRRVAVKVLKAEYSEDAEFVERFRAEARTVAMLNHPGIASVYDYGETDMDGEGRTAYLVMELVNGEPLNSVIKRTGRPCRSLTPQAWCTVTSNQATSSSRRPGRSSSPTSASPRPSTPPPSPRPAW